MLWVKCCQEVQAHLRSGDWLDLEGEAGVGKLTVAQGAHLAITPGAHLRVLDADDCADRSSWLGAVVDELARRAGTLVLRHVDRLPAEVLRALTDAARADPA